jgi:mono/diheme cytochrome c family protein
MPDYRLSAVEAADLAAFLATRTDTAMFPVPPITSPPLTSEEAARGRELVAEYACLGCHEISGAGSRLGPSLDGTGDRLQPAYVHALLMDPQAVVPGTPMKNFRLWDEETRALTAYLMALHAGPGPTGPVPR